jgi:hypothetical protein
MLEDEDKTTDDHLLVEPAVLDQLRRKGNMMREKPDHQLSVEKRFARQKRTQRRKLKLLQSTVFPETPNRSLRVKITLTGAERSKLL